MDEPLETFNAHRSRLLGIAYRMLGSRAAAEDVLQEAYIRWHQSDRAQVRSAEAWLGLPMPIQVHDGSGGLRKTTLG